VSHLPYNFRKCRKLVTSVANDVQTYCCDNDTKEALITSHMTELKEENSFTEVKQLLTPERNPEIKVLRGERSPTAAPEALALPYKASGSVIMLLNPL
jgi:hypothetical protein